ncbi:MULTISPECIES: LamG-like jellyroll fold domain-containing protein [unclassified Lentimicrobium]|uniref:LamG-like jellyroll fold domain-containing protein n=1 Tax=unclassified Lentimicrobium TaxID=2677434 RepID=UPI0015523CD4|nr:MULTISPECIES: LamG-like jellyroll fold domain-containing protein [unclassified Lentimicrobium]NPD47418.1 T9SS type A sorting domain-containing protein [Lentimicrobium sp. S6]NPD85096.1 T9SS type A sorting domain-containing protein [Lentimicrobium sp. L6]
MLLKRFIFLFFIFWGVGNMAAQQIIIPRIEQMPNLPQPYLMRDWKQVAQSYDSLVFDRSLSGEYLPLVGINASGINYPNHENAAMVTYVGQPLGTSAEGINYLPAIIGATLAGIDKSNQFEKNWVLMSEDFFNLGSDENVYLNNYSASSGNDWWYETMPNIFFYQLNDLYPNTGAFNYQFETIANRWLEAVREMGGNSSPWQIPYMNYRAWNLEQMIPLTEGVKQPEAAGAIAWILYNAYVKTQNEDYLIGAEWALEFLNNWNENPSYEIQLPYGTYIAARMNAEIGTNYDIEKMLNWSFDRGNLRGWGTIIGQWGDYDCSGLIGEANDGGNDYAFIMNGFQHAAALVPLVRYDEHYADAIGKWILNLANASRLFYPGFLPADQQDSEEWALANDPHNSIAHEALKEILNDKSPFATGDAVRNGWAPTNLALYGASHVGYLGGMVSLTNVEAVLKLNLCKTDFYSNAYPSFLIWNPYDNDTLISLDVGEETIDIYNSIDNAFMLNNVSGTVDISIPANKSVILVYVPNNADLTNDGKKTLANSLVIDFDNGEIITDVPPRIKALKALKNPIVISDSIKIFCSVQDENPSELSYHWSIDDQSIDGESILAIKAPIVPGFYNIKCVLVSESGLSDSSTITIEVKDRIPFIPEIKSLKASPGKIDLGESSMINCQVYEENGDEIVFEWITEEGSILGSGEEIQWTAPMMIGDYKIYCKVSDSDGGVRDSIIVMVRDISSLEIGEPILYLPFSGNVNDESPFHQETTAFNIQYEEDVYSLSENAAAFNGSSSYIRITNNEQLNFKAGLTLTAWIYAQNINAGEAYPISHGNWDDRWKVSIANHILRFTVKTNYGVKDLDAKILLNNDSWYHMAMVYSGTDLEIYINGELDSFIPFSGEISSTSYDLVLGKARPDQDFYYRGRLDEIYLFDHPLSPTHIMDIYDNVSSTWDLGNVLENVKVFPNPAKEALYIELHSLAESEINYEFIDLSGRTLLKGIWTNHKTLFQLNTKQMESGLYLLKIQIGELSKVKKIIISK